MTTLYEQNLLEIHAQALTEEMKLRERKFYNKNDLIALENKWRMRCFMYGAICSLITAVIAHYWR